MTNVKVRKKRRKGQTKGKRHVEWSRGSVLEGRTYVDVPSAWRVRSSENSLIKDLHAGLG